MHNKDRTISGAGIRIDFMRIAPESEEYIVNEFRERLGNEEVAIFKALGHYDLIFVYSKFDERDVFFLGSIDGIRSFSYLDCFYFSDIEYAEIINKLLKSKILASTICTMRRSFLAESGGVDNTTIREKISKNIFYLLSLSWGEQIFLYPNDEMFALWNNSRDLINWIHPNALDIHSIFGINYTLIEQLESSAKPGWKWDEPIDPSFYLEWQIELSCKKGDHSLILFNEIVDKIVEKSQHKFKLEGRSHLFSHSILKCQIVGSDWGSVIKSIRNIRKKGTNIINSTKLLIYQNPRP